MIMFELYILHIIYTNNKNYEYTFLRNLCLLLKKSDFE